nr:protein ACCELERATED CELL DEATH 6-like [Ipomoea batatas]GME10781.1 protein ACCELERATED CELL DEATH 6-like [Ipomoea batatas]
MFGISGWKGVYIDYIVARFKREHLVFNKLHQTTLDMGSQRDVYSAFKHVSGGIPQRSGRRSGPRADLLQIQETNSEDADKEIKRCLRISKTMTIVATLILTLSFAAGFTVPGGYDSNKGYPILLRNKAFGNFVAANAIAFTSSVSAIFIYMIMVVVTLWGSIREQIVMPLCTFNILTTFSALIAAVAAFLCGTQAIVNSLDAGNTFFSYYVLLLVWFCYCLARLVYSPLHHL